MDLVLYHIKCLNGWDEKHHEGVIMTGPDRSDIAELGRQFKKQYRFPEVPHLPSPPAFERYREQKNQALAALAVDFPEIKHPMVGDYFREWLRKHHEFFYVDVEKFHLLVEF